MKRWNGWGDTSVAYPLPERAADLLSERLGPGVQKPDAEFDQVLTSVPTSRLSPHPLVTTDPEARIRHARGQSLPDWIALRSGRIGVFPDGVAYPETDQDTRALLDYAREIGARLIPYGGGTSVVGHITPLPGARPVLTLDLCRMNRLLALDEKSHLATFEAGVAGPDLERQLDTRRMVLGHYPQSFEYSTLGGWIATRSTGQQSYYYGRIEALWAGGHVETPSGALDLPPHPASAAGPDLKQILLGSEGRLGVITRAIVRVRLKPEVEEFFGVFFREWGEGAEALRELAQGSARVSMLRLSDPPETETTLALAGRERLMEWAERGLGAAGFPSPRSLLLYGVTGERGAAERARVLTNRVARKHGGLPVPVLIGPMWAKTRFRTPYLRNALWDAGYAIDTLETALPWAAVMPAAAAIADALRKGLSESGERVLVLTHFSHVYLDGASLYVTFLFRRTADPEELLDRWKKLKAAASRAIVQCGGTISHQHGVGLDHAAYLAAEKGELGMALLDAIRRTADPEGIMNPGKLFRTEG